MTDVQEIRSIDELGEIRSLWQSLLAETPGASFFQSLDWLEVYWKHFGADQKLRVLVATEAGQPVGIVPLVVHPEATKVGRLRFLTYPLDFWGSFFSWRGLRLGPADPGRTDLWSFSARLTHPACKRLRPDSLPAWPPGASRW